MLSLRVLLAELLVLAAAQCDVVSNLQVLRKGFAGSVICSSAAWQLQQEVLPLDVTFRDDSPSTQTGADGPYALLAWAAFELTPAVAGQALVYKQDGGPWNLDANLTDLALQAAVTELDSTFAEFALIASSTIVVYSDERQEFFTYILQNGAWTFARVESRRLRTPRLGVDSVQIPLLTDYEPTRFDVFLVRTLAYDSGINLWSEVFPTLEVPEFFELPIANDQDGATLAIRGGLPGDIFFPSGLHLRVE